VSKTHLLKYIKLFEDDLTLDNLTIAQLRPLCRILQVKIVPFATPDLLRFHLNLRLRELRADDKLIMHEGGVDTLTVERLMEACRERGMRAMGMSEQRLRQQLTQWLELSQVRFWTFTFEQSAIFRTSKSPSRCCYYRAPSTSPKTCNLRIVSRTFSVLCRKM
jgi:hypothetical protein